MNRNIQEIICKVQYAIADSFLNALYLSNLDYAVIKGSPLAYYKTGNPGTRLSSDIDILISRKDITKITEILRQNGFESSYNLSRKERVMMISHSHQVPSYSKSIGKFCSQIDVNFDLFWGEYIGRRIDISEFLKDTVEMEIYGCKIKTLKPLKSMVQLILHHYKEMNSLYVLTERHAAIHKRLFEDVYILCKKYPEEISVENLYAISYKYNIVPYVYYMFYYTRKVYDDSMLDAYLEALLTEEGEALLNYYGLTKKERRLWKIGFQERLDIDISEVVYRELTERDKEKIEQNKILFV